MSGNYSISISRRRLAVGPFLGMLTMRVSPTRRAVMKSVSASEGKGMDRNIFDEELVVSIY